MFGYVTPDNPYLYMKDYRLYNSFYCQACKSIGRKCGQIARFSLTYDIAFLSAVVHNMTGVDVVIKDRICLVHPLRKSPVAVCDEISDTLGCLNVILAYYKTNDNVIDSGKGRFARVFFKSGYKRAAKAFPQFDEIVKTNYEKLRELEINGEKSIDRIADPFAVMLAELSKLLLKRFADENSYNFFYNFGKWIYLIDALDDYDTDIRKKSFNVFYSAYGAKDYKTLLEEYGEELAFIMNSVRSGIKEGLERLKFTYNADLIANIAIRGTNATTKRIFSKVKNKKKG